MNFANGELEGKYIKILRYNVLLRWLLRDVTVPSNCKQNDHFPTNLVLTVLQYLQAKPPFPSYMVLTVLQ
jgi:hypothetical protein